MNFSASNGSDQGSSIDVGPMGVSIRSPGRDWITVRIGKSKKITINQIDYWLFGWKEVLPAIGSGLVYDVKEFGDYGAVPYTGSETISIRNPIAALSNQVLPEGAKVFARQRVPHPEYGFIYECIAEGGGGGGPVQSVQCIGNTLVVTYN